MTRAGKSAFFSLALLLLAWSLWGHRIPTDSLRWTVAAAGLGATVCGLGWATRWHGFCGWAALAFVGQAFSLQLWDVGQGSRLQLFHGWERLLGTYRAIFLCAVVVQASVVWWGARRFWSELKPQLRSLLSVPQLVVFSALIALSAITISPSVPQALLTGGFLTKTAISLSKIALGMTILGVGALNLLLAVRTIPGNAWERIITGWKKTNRQLLPWVCAGWVVVVSSLFAVAVFDRLPHVPDEVAYLFHAKYLSAGRLYLPLPPEPDAFACAWVIADGEKWYSSQFPGWPALLVLGVWARLPWLVNPLLGGLAILLAHILIRRLYDRTVADAVVLLLAFSPWLLIVSATFMSHPASLVFALAALLGVEHARENGSMVGGAVAGLMLGGLALTRPLEALAWGSVAAWFWFQRGSEKLRLPTLTAAMVTGLALLGLHLEYNRLLTGSRLTVPFEKLIEGASYPGANRLGFGVDVGNFGWTHLDPLPGHGPIDVAVNTNQNLYMLNFELFGWASGSLVLVVFLFVLGWRTWRRDALMWLGILAIWLVMSVYWFGGGPDYGARYWYQMIVPLAVLTVRGAQEFSHRWARAGESRKTTGNHQWVWAFVVLASIIGSANVIPWRALDKYKNYRGVREDVRRLEREHKFGRSLVFVRGEGPVPPWSSSQYASAFSLNPPTLDRNSPCPIYARDLGPDSRERLQSYFSDRPVWTIACPTDRNPSFHVVEGPLAPPEP